MTVLWRGVCLRSAPTRVHRPAEARLAAFGIGNVVNCWTPLVSATAKNGAMKIIPKSQNAGILRHVQIGMYYTLFPPRVRFRLRGVEGGAL